jgi:hypothetical protein
MMVTIMKNDANSATHPAVTLAVIAAATALLVIRRKARASLLWETH